MAYAMTPWGYEVDGTLSPLVSVAQFNTATGNRWASDPRTEGAVLAASTAVRNACGWHVSPSMPCRYTADTDGGHTIMLPAALISGVTSLTLDGTETDDYQWSYTGAVQSGPWLPFNRMRGAVVEYTAGVATDGALAALVIGMANRALALAPGVTQETAGGVSISYAPSAATGGVVPYVNDAEGAQLAPYKVVRAHAT